MAGFASQRKYEREAHFQKSMSALLWLCFLFHNWSIMFGNKGALFFVLPSSQDPECHSWQAQNSQPHFFHTISITCLESNGAQTACKNWKHIDTWVTTCYELSGVKQFLERVTTMLEICWKSGLTCFWDGAPELTGRRTSSISGDRMVVMVCTVKLHTAKYELQALDQYCHLY